MTVPTSNLWKSATASARPSSRTADRNIHIGETLRDLYGDSKAPRVEERLERLLEELETVERERDLH